VARRTLGCKQASKQAPLPGADPFPPFLPSPAAYKSCDNYGTKVPSGSWANRRYWGLCCNGNFFAFNKKVTGKKCTKIQLNPPKPQPVPKPSKG
jgi:hypothetical protein